jgi:UDP-N-acetylmuramoyl-tripeptide--D-alanyl-D-alanine ligase
MILSIDELHDIVGGRLRLGDMPPRHGALGPIGPIVADSRNISPGDVFWALKGATHDGSHFAEEALAQGAAGVVASGRWVAPWAGRWSLEVDDATSALWRLAAWSCGRFAGRLITVEGALGKSITTAMTASVLNTRLAGVTITPDNGSHVTGQAAVSLAQIPSHHEYAIVELHTAAIPSGCFSGRLAQAELAVFVHSGASAVAGSLSAPPDPAIIDRLQTLVKSGAAAIINGDDCHLRRAAHGGRHVILIGRGSDAHIVAERVESSNGMLRFSVAGQQYRVAAHARHHLTAALAAIAVGRQCGLSDLEIAEGLASYQSPAPVWQVSQADDVTIIDDTRHRHPAATIAAMDLLNQFGSPGRRIVLCGDLAEGDIDSQSRSMLGEQAVTRAGADLLIAGGSGAEEVVSAANRAGMPRTKSVAHRTLSEAGHEAALRIRPGDALLMTGQTLSTMQHTLQKQIIHLRRAA